jgi:hypothetical protein
VQRPGLADAVLTLPWTVVSPTEAYRRPVQISNQPIAPWLNLAAALSVLVIAGAASGLWLRQRQTHTALTQHREIERDARTVRRI